MPEEKASPRFGQLGAWNGRLVLMPSPFPAEFLEITAHGHLLCAGPWVEGFSHVISFHHHSHAFS